MESGRRVPGLLPEVPYPGLEACRRLGIEVVRRPSGGRAVLHMGDLTYAVIAGTADGIPSAVTAAYRLICDGLLKGFRLLGIDARLGRGVIKPPPHEICFLRGTLGSIVYQERKFVGSAQTWHASSMLQHGSIIIDAADRDIDEFMAGERRFPGGVAS